MSLIRGHALTGAPSPYTKLAIKIARMMVLHSQLLQSLLMLMVHRAVYLFYSSGKKNENQGNENDGVKTESSVN